MLPTRRGPIDIASWPRAWRYGVALLVTAVVTAIAWWVGGDEPVPAWADGMLVPILGWVFVMLLLWRLLAHLLRKKS